jgi:hypothetical protein
MVFDLLLVSPPRWSNGYCTCHWTQDLWVQTWLRTMDGNTNSQHNVLRRGSKAGGPILEDFTACQKSPQYKRVTCRQNLWIFFAKFLPASLLGVSAGYCQRSVLGESGMIRTQMGKHSRSVVVAVYGTPCVIQPPNSNHNSNACNLMTKTLTFSLLAAKYHYTKNNYSN